MQRNDNCIFNKIAIYLQQTFSDYIENNLRVSFLKKYTRGFRKLMYKLLLIQFIFYKTSRKFGRFYKHYEDILTTPTLQRLMLKTDLMYSSTVRIIGNVSCITSLSSATIVRFFREDPVGLNDIILEFSALSNRLTSWFGQLTRVV